MTRTDDPPPALRVSVPTLEPDDAFVERLSALAAVSGAADPGPAPLTRRGWRAGLAAAGMATVLAGGGVVAAAVTGPDEAPSPPRGPATPGEPSGVDITPDGAEPAQPSPMPRDEVGSPGGSTPAGSQDRAQDRAQRRGENGVGASGTGGQAGQLHGRAGENHGQQDGNGDEAHGEDGLPHGQAGQYGLQGEQGQQGEQGRSDESPGYGKRPAPDHASSRGGPEGSGDV